MIKPTDKESGDGETWKHGEIWFFGLILSLLLALVYGLYWILITYTAFTIDILIGFGKFILLIISFYVLGYAVLFILYNVEAWVSNDD